MSIGSNFDDFLKEEGLYEVATAYAMKKVLALQIEEANESPATHQNRHGQTHAHQPCGGGGVGRGVSIELKAD